MARQPLPLHEQLKGLDRSDLYPTKQSSVINGQNSFEKGESSKKMDSEDDTQHCLLWAITARNDDFDGAFELEAQAQGYRELRPNVFTVGGADGGVEQQGVWRRLVGLRLIVSWFLRHGP